MAHDSTARAVDPHSIALLPAAAPAGPGTGPIEMFWSVWTDEHLPYVALPDGRANVLVRCRMDGDGHCAGIVPEVVGPSSRPHPVPLVPGDGAIGLRLRAGRLGFLDGAGPLADRRLLGTEAIRLLPELGVIPERTLSFNALFDGFLTLMRGLRGLPPVPDVEAALARLHAAEGRMEPGALTEALGIGPRRLHRLFARHVGLSPQGYAAVLRFQHAVRLRGDGLAPTDSADEAGYADQSHMTRAFRRHGGFTPARMPEVSLKWPPLR